MTPPVALLAVAATVTPLPPATAPLIDGESCDAVPQLAAASVAVLLRTTVTIPDVGFEPFSVLVCSGVVISPRAVLTAAHCLDPIAMTLGEGNDSGTEYFVSFEADLTDLASQRTIDFPADAVLASARIVPDSFDFERFVGESRLGDFSDIGVLVFDVDLPVAPVSVATAGADAGRIGDAIYLVGWGVTEPPAGMGGFTDLGGARLCGVGVIEDRADTEVRTSRCGTRRCLGDSGGPSFVEVVSGTGERTWQLLTIGSRSADGSLCAEGSIDTRVDAWLPWLEDTVADLPPADGVPRNRIDDPIPDALAQCIETTDPPPPDDPGGCAQSAALTPWWLLLGLLILCTSRRRRSASMKFFP